MRLRVLSVSCVFPNPVEPEAGLFVRHRLQAIARQADVTVIAPVPAIDYGNPRGRLLASRAVPRERRDGNLRVLHPRWLYPPFGGVANAFCLAARLIPLLFRQRACDLIDAHWAYPAGIAVALASRFVRRPFLVTIRGNEIEHGRSRLKKWAMAWALRRADGVICLSERLRQFAAACGVDPGRIRTIPNGIDAAVFHPRDRRACRQGHGIPDDAPVVLSAGQLIELKGHHHIVRALREARPAHLLIAGGPGRHVQYEAEIRRQIRAADMEGRVHFAGQVPQETLAGLMAAADVLCLASSREGWPNVVQEAMACGTPVVATDVGAVPDMIPSDDYGYVVPPGDESRLRAALQSALNRSWDRERISALGQSRSWDLVAGQVLEEMRRVVGGL
jgi:glycosyltransferase involved in cell wall biosynthesis